jgi:hypothetical protein
MGAYRQAFNASTYAGLKRLFGMIIPHLIILGMFVTDRQGVRTSDRYHMFFNACGAKTASIR